MVAEGQPAPTFTLPSDSGEDVSLESLRGRPVVLYFYPKDDTPGCTAQACGIRDVWKEKSMYGKKYMGIERSTFVVDRDGNLARELRKVKPSEHAGLVLKVLAAL
jgi:peroxiredoxin Q/BCP